MKIPVLLGAFWLSLQANAADAATLAESKSAYGVFDVNRAEALYRSVASSAASDHDRAVARRELARIAWLVDGDGERAVELLEAALPNDPDPCPGALLYARILNDSSPPAAIRQKLAPWAIACREIEPRVALEQVRSYAHQAGAARGRTRQRIAAHGLQLWSALPADARASSEGAKLQILLGVQALDPTQAMKGWRSYFWLDAPALAVPAIDLDDREIEQAFRNGLMAHARAEERERLAALLMRAGFADALEQLVASAAEFASPATESGRIVNSYLAFRNELFAEILRHDRAYARGRTDDAYEKRLSALLFETARKLEPGATDVRAVLRKNFGVWGTEPGKSNGVSGIHLGHVLSDGRRQVSQDGRTGQIQLIVLDNMIHNSFSAWLMDGASAPGGWAVNGSTIVQVRPRYLMLIDEFVRLANPGPARDRALAELDRQASADRRIAAVQPLSFLPGVKARLRFQAIQKLAAETRAQTSSEEEFQRTFRRSYWNALLASSIDAHEGRHVLDQLSFRENCALANEELEYRAKLSEIRFAPSPRLAVSSIYSSLFGGTSGHGIANARLFADYANWMAKNAGSVKDYEPSLTQLEQLDRLSDEQLVGIAESLEPKQGTCLPTR